MDIGFERISPTPNYLPGVNAVSLASYKWNSKATAVTTFKERLKADLRRAQVGRCCYCRRLLFDDIATHIEHFIEKAQYHRFAFEIRNLALSCGTCNTQKNGTNAIFLSYLRKRRKRTKPRGKIGSPRCQTLAKEPSPNAPLPVNPQDYRWVHPHFDKYSDNIQINKGWIFVGKTLKGSRTIRGVRLNALSLIEQRALFERLSMRGGRLSLLLAAVAELEHHRAKEVAVVLSKLLRKRRNSPA